MNDAQRQRKVKNQTDYRERKKDSGLSRLDLTVYVPEHLKPEIREHLKRVVAEYLQNP